MESKFIELHTRDRDSGAGDPMSVNVEAIQCFHPDPDSALPDKPGVVEATDGSFYTVTESYAEIKQLIHDSGILIRRADPRLDETHRLTMEDLQDMIGEPVWNSNTGKWTLVRNYIDALEPDGVDVAFLLDAADNSTGMTAGDLVKFPLYRMRRTLD